ncbi:carboxymuconolactone decarboxylase family protein [Fuchsiella alkaliacetigena]|uniref:carboxymuconolactone decarboxylase family protein n=1 Tax=Fuchsiella alkaliacetigena TaxID=957042 RepID=UPI00200B0EFF|nr:carboxymuconolactone decarboxylase family protein [Fuchsiella alkaliacetigena]MCK8823911.1 carboxymuconolactone decarboxylase family protein [Fuchsiella alkaliacetigena]
MSEKKGSPAFMEITREKDEELGGLMDQLLELINKPGALDAKTKTLIILALDALENHGDGVEGLAARARDLGATEEEIKEVIRIVFVVSGLQSLVAGSRAYKD